MNRENPGAIRAPLLLGLIGLLSYAQPGKDPFRSALPFQDFTIVSKPDPFDATQSLELRARSYLDSRCSYCHRPGGVKPSMDLRYTTPLARTNLFGPSGRAGPDGKPLYRIHPGNTRASDVYIRLASVGSDAMPPTGKSQVDEEGLDLIRGWILSLAPESRSRKHPALERNFPLILDPRRRETEFVPVGSDSTRAPVVAIFDAAGGRMSGYTLAPGGNPRSPNWTLRFSQAIPRGMYWIRLRWGADKAVRVLLVL